MTRVESLMEASLRFMVEDGSSECIVGRKTPSVYVESCGLARTGSSFTYALSLQNAWRSGLIHALACVGEWSDGKVGCQVCSSKRCVTEGLTISETRNWASWLPRCKAVQSKSSLHGGEAHMSCREWAVTDNRLEQRRHSSSMLDPRNYDICRWGFKTPDRDTKSASWILSWQQTATG